MAKRSTRTLPPIVAAINALDRHGKTRWLLSAPKPIDLFHIDPNTEMLVDKLIREGEIDADDVILHEVPYPATVFGKRDEIQNEATAAWEDKFVEPLRDVVDNDNRTIGLDTATELFELKLMADHGKSVQILPEMRTKTNYVFKSLLQALRRSKKHVVLLHRLKDVWLDTEVETNKGVETQRNKVAGMYEREGFNRTGYHVNVEAFLMYEPKRGGSEPNQFGMRVHSCLERPSLVTCQADEKTFWDLDDEAWKWGRQKYEDGSRVRRSSFPYLATQIYPDTTIDDWK